MISHYRWEGKVERAEEVVAVFKTRASPAIAVIALESVDRDYFGWILDATKEG